MGHPGFVVGQILTPLRDPGWIRHTTYTMLLATHYTTVQLHTPPVPVAVST